MNTESNENAPENAKKLVENMAADLEFLFSKPDLITKRNTEN